MKKRRVNSNGLHLGASSLMIWVPAFAGMSGFVDNPADFSPGSPHRDIREQPLEPADGAVFQPRLDRHTALRIRR